MGYDRILLDIETQRDFFVPGGSCYRSGATEAADQVYRLFQWAKEQSVPVISTVLRVRDGLGPLSATPHCADGTDGERKLSRTVLPRRVNLGLLNTTDLPGELFARYQQAIFEKRQTDIFAHARLERLITEIREATFVICGAGVAHGIVQAAVGLRSRGFGVIVAEDAIVDLGHPLAAMARLRMEAKGAIFAPTSEIIAPRPRKTRPFRPVVAAPAIAPEALQSADDEDDD
jgi:nicotinamidase-related amidase